MQIITCSNDEPVDWRKATGILLDMIVVEYQHAGRHKITIISLLDEVGVFHSLAKGHKADQTDKHVIDLHAHFSNINF